MGLVAPHVRRAIRIGKVIDLAKVEAVAFADVLDRLAAAVFLVIRMGEWSMPTPTAAPSSRKAR